LAKPTFVVGIGQWRLCQLITPRAGELAKPIRIAHPPSSIVHHPSSIIHHPSSILHRPSSIINYSLLIAMLSLHSDVQAHPTP
jgi:hypothetical protein